MTMTVNNPSTGGRILFYITINMEVCMDRFITRVKVWLVTKFNLFLGNGTFYSWDGSKERVLVWSGMVIFKDRIVGHFISYADDIVLD